jgi:L-fuconolactonase
MPTADAHLHLFRDGYADGFAGPPGTNAELATYERLRAHFGIERGLVVGYDRGPQYAGNNDYILDLARDRSWIAPLAYLPAAPPTVEQLRELHRRGAVGFALYLPEASDASALAAWPVEALAELRAQRAILSLNANPASTSLLAEFVEALDGCAILFSHLGLPGQFDRIPKAAEARERLAPLLAVAQREQVAVKFSGLYGVSDPAHDFPHAAAQPFVDVLLGAFGPARLLWGSDFSPALDFVSLAQTADVRPLAACSPAEVAQVMGGNLLRLLDDRPREE